MADSAVVDSVKAQYERYPYPPVSALALPLRSQGRALRYEFGCRLAHAAGYGQGLAASHAGMRILVAGCGTLEALVVAQMHPAAHEVVAVDLSETSIKRLGRRYRLARARDVLHLAALRGKALPKLTRITADLNSWRGGEFDLIIASNVLHHTPDAAALLKHLASMLRPNGLMRVVTYPAMSRFWIRRTRAWLQRCGVSAEAADVRRRAAAAVDMLPNNHPIQSCFRGHSETTRAAGLVDAFLHALERPLAPFQWQQAAADAGLLLIAEAQREDCRGDFLRQLKPALAELGRWQRLQIMDDLLELSTSPVLWFRRGEDDEPVRQMPATQAPAGEAHMLWHGQSVQAVVARPEDEWWLPSRIYFDMGESLRRVAAQLNGSGVELSSLLAALDETVGGRVDRRGRDLPGLAITDYNADDLLATPQPWPDEYWFDECWSDACRQALSGCALHYKDERVPGETLSEQACWLQLRYGAEAGLIGPLRFMSEE